MKGESVLVVDDNFANLKLMCLLLESEGYQVKTAMSADEALEVLQCHNPDFILMDIQLPGMDGLTLTRKIKQNKKFENIIIVALTAYAMKGDEERAKESGCAGYITKPIDTRTFTETMKQYFQKANLIDGDISGHGTANE